MDLRKSNLGDLVDDLEGEKQRLREYEYRMASLEELNSMKDDQVSLLIMSYLLYDELMTCQLLIITSSDC